MKSKKIIAMIVAFAAFMAIATSGLAATTTYNYRNDGYVDVNVKVAADPDKEVTYLVKNGDNIVYIDQKTADPTTGAVEFSYKILDSKVSYTSTLATFGTDGSAVVTSDGDSTLAFANASASGDTYTITYYEDVDTSKEISGTAILGTGDTVYAKVAAASGYKVDEVKVGGVVTEDTVIPVAYGQTIDVKTSEVVSTPHVDDTTITVTDEVDEANGTVTKTKVVKVTGTYTEAGVTFEGQDYPAMADENTKYTGAGYFAVKLIVPSEYSNLVPSAYAR